MSKIYRLCRHRQLCVPASAKRRNEAIVNVGNLYWLSSVGTGLPTASAKRRNEAIVNMGKYCRLSHRFLRFSNQAGRPTDPGLPDDGKINVVDACLFGDGRSGATQGCGGPPGGCRERSRRGWAGRVAASRVDDRGDGSMAGRRGRSRVRTAPGEAVPISCVRTRGSGEEPDIGNRPGLGDLHQSDETGKILGRAWTSAGPGTFLGSGPGPERFREGARVCRPFRGNGPGRVDDARRR